MTAETIELARQRIAAAMKHGCYIGPPGQKERDESLLAQAYVVAAARLEKLERVAEVAAKIEWASPLMFANGTYESNCACPVCGNSAAESHTTDCEFGTALAALNEPQPKEPNR